MSVADRMGKLFRENPIQVAFPEAVNLFSARAKFVREASQKSTVSQAAKLQSARPLNMWLRMLFPQSRSRHTCIPRS